MKIVTNSKNFLIQDGRRTPYWKTLFLAVTNWQWIVQFKRNFLFVDLTTRTMENAAQCRAWVTS